MTKRDDDWRMKRRQARREKAGKKESYLKPEPVITEKAVSRGNAVDPRVKVMLEGFKL